MHIILSNHKALEQPAESDDTICTSKELYAEQARKDNDFSKIEMISE